MNKYKNYEILLDDLSSEKNMYEIVSGIYMIGRNTKNGLHKTCTLKINKFDNMISASSYLGVEKNRLNAISSEYKKYVKLRPSIDLRLEFLRSDSFFRL